jgi:hypothetical protein
VTRAAWLNDVITVPVASIASLKFWLNIFLNPIRTYA